MCSGRCFRGVGDGADRGLREHQGREPHRGAGRGSARGHARLHVASQQRARQRGALHQLGRPGEAAAALREGKVFNTKSSKLFLHFLGLLLLTQCLKSVKRLLSTNLKLMTKYSYVLPSLSLIRVSGAVVRVIVSPRDGSGPGSSVLCPREAAAICYPLNY